MNEQYNVPLQVELPAKRKRGRPRKDASVVTKPSLQSHRVALSPETTMEAQHSRANIGGVVTGVVDGIFDAGYLITIRIGNNSTPLRGIVFQPGRYVPVSPANDIAPQAMTYQRMEVQNQGNGIVSEEVVKLSSMVKENQELISEIHSHSSPPMQNLRMVEQDEVMQVFEVSTSSAENTKTDAKDANGDIDQVASQMPFMELLQSSMGTNREEGGALGYKKERTENLHEILVTSQVQSTEGSQSRDRTIESKFQQPSAFPDDLHQTTPIPDCLQHHQQELKTSETMENVGLHRCPKVLESHQESINSELQANKSEVQNGSANSINEVQHQTTPSPECVQHQQELKTSENTDNVGIQQCPQVLESHQESIRPVDSELQANKSQVKNGLTDSTIDLQHQKCVQQDHQQQQPKTSENTENVDVHQCPQVPEIHQQSIHQMESETQASELLTENGVTNSGVEHKQQPGPFNGSQMIELIQEPNQPIDITSTMEKPRSLENDPSNLQAPPFST